MMRVALVLLCLAASAGMAHSVEPDEILEDPALEARARDISKGLRCLVCQNQSIDDSDAPLARDLRIIVRERLQAGDENDEVIAFVTQRYGDFVLLEPPIKPATYLLWFGPALLLLIGVAIVWRATQRRSKPSTMPDELSAEERARVDALLARQGEDKNREDT